MDAVLRQEITRNIGLALQEDQVDKDLTSHACFAPSSLGVAELILKDDAIIAGLIFLPLICEAVDPKVEAKLHKKEGETGKKGDLLATVLGPVRSLMALERTAINFIQHATSIATQTNRYVQAAEGKCDILDTRKTLPGHRFLQKYAVSIGGGKNHRLHLGDQVLIKDNHLSQLENETKEPIRESLQRARAHAPNKKIQIEVDSLDALKCALEFKPDAILLDNMSPDQVKQAALICPEGIYLEASGGIDLTTIRSYARAGIHGISIGRLTHSIDAVDMSFKI
ncbi:carboxylating nicotinate-nucleotide diphosphorylase [Simkania sp.]|uniref:carboxylating nicotinate-nucleotide diphosphorylase n=1 Tax=Simkania sp. TaxID=34094 RepID=UPI003B52F765